MKAISILVLSVFLLAACQKGVTVRESSDGDFKRLQGASLVLKEPLQVPAGQARVHIWGRKPGANGGLLSGGFGQYGTRCAFEIDSVDHAGFTIQPETFPITLVQGSRTPVVMMRPIQVASLQLASGMDGPGSSGYYEGYHFWLTSERQPEVRRMTCYGLFAEPPDLQPPTLREIQRVLDGVAEIRF